METSVPPLKKKCAVAVVSKHKASGTINRWKHMKTGHFLPTRSSSSSRWGAFGSVPAMIQNLWFWGSQSQQSQPPREKEWRVSWDHCTICIHLFHLDSFGHMIQFKSRLHVLIVIPIDAGLTPHNSLVPNDHESTESTTLNPMSLSAYHI